MRQRRIRTKPEMGAVEISGWLADANRTYLWFGLNGNCIGTLGGQRLYRLAKAIVRRFEEKP